jgi:hypothetical protein
MLIAGLWHGASYKFIFWGGAFGLGLVINRLYLSLTKKKFQKKFIPAWLGWVITFNFVSLLWIFFRAETFQEAVISIQTIIFNMELDYIIPFFNSRTLFSILFFIGFLLVFFPASYKKRIQRVFTGLPIVVKALLFIIVVQLIIQFQSENIQPFIYFQF